MNDNKIIKRKLSVFCQTSGIFKINEKSTKFNQLVETQSINLHISSAPFNLEW